MLISNLDGGMVNCYSDVGSFQRVTITDRERERESRAKNVDSKFNVVCNFLRCSLLASGKGNFKTSYTTEDPLKQRAF